jgi:hypothetical protein
MSCVQDSSEEDCRLVSCPDIITSPGRRISIDDNFATDSHRVTILSVTIIGYPDSATNSVTLSLSDLVNV